MKIGFDAKRYFHNNTGLGNYSRGLIHDLNILEEPLDIYLFDKKAKKSNYQPLAGTNVISSDSIFPFWRQIGMVNKIESLNLDIFHGLSAELPLTKPRKTKLVVTIHDLIFLKFPAYYPFLDRLIYTYKLRNALTSADKVICASNKTKEDILQIFPINPNKLEVIPQSCHPRFYVKKSDVELEMFRKKHELPDKYLLCVSKFEKRKNHLQLLKAFSTVANQVSMPLVLVGRKGDTFETVKNWLLNSEIKNEVKLITEVPEEDLPAFYQAAEWTLFPSVYEGFGIPVLESMASGTPVMVNQNSSMSEIVGNNKYTFDANDLESFANSLLDVTDVLKRQQAMQMVQQNLEKYNSENIANQHYTLYKSLV